MINRPALAEACQAHGVTVEQIEYLMGGEVTQDTKRAAWELIKSARIRRAVALWRAGFKGARVLSIRLI